MKFHEFGGRKLPHVLLIHGGGQAWWDYLRQARMLSLNYHVILPTLDGHGEEYMTEYVSTEDSAGKIIKYINESCGGSVFAIGGVSLGGQIVIEILSQRPDIAQKAIIDGSLCYPQPKLAKCCTAFVRCFWPLLFSRSASRLELAVLNKYMPAMRLPEEIIDYSIKNKNSDGVMMSPVNGLCIDLSEVPDKVFSERMIGDGVAFIYEDDMICSPCNGTVVMVADTSHAIGIKSGEIEIIIHIGLDTVELNGEGIKVFVKTDQKVKVGTPLVRIDRNFMKEKSVNLTTPMIITNTGDFKLEFKNTGKEVERSKSEVIKYTKSE